MMRAQRLQQLQMIGKWRKMLINFTCMSLSIILIFLVLVASQMQSVAYVCVHHRKVRNAVCSILNYYWPEAKVRIVIFLLLTFVCLFLSGLWWLDLLFRKCCCSIWLGLNMVYRISKEKRRSAQSLSTPVLPEVSVIY